MESRRLPSRRNKRVDSPVLKGKSPSGPRRGASANRTSSPALRKEKEKESPPKNDRKRGRPKITPVKVEEKYPRVSIKKVVSVPTVEDFKSIKASSSSIHSVKTTTSVRTVNLGGAGAETDAEIARLTSLGQNLLNRRSTSKGTTPLHNLTPTPTTEHSRQSRSISRSVYDDDDYSRTEYSDNEADDQFQSVKGPEETAGDYSTHMKSLYSNPNVSSSSRQVPLPREYGGFIGITLLLLIVPALAYYIQWCCTKSSQCTFKKINTTGWNLKYLEKVFDLQTVGAYLGFQFVVFILSSFPLGRVVSIRNDRGILKYYFNSLAVAIITVVAFLTAEFYFKYPVADFITRNYLRICLFSIINAMIVSFWCYIMSRYQTSPQTNNDLQNPYGKSGNFIVDYALGRDINPKWCGIVDIKLSHYRISLMTMICMITVFMLKNLHVPILPTTDEQHLDNSLDILKSIFGEVTVIDRSALFCTILFAIYVMDIIVFEHHLASSFDLQQEGVGALLLVRYAVTPFFLASIPKYALEHKSLDLPSWSICVITVLFAIGLLLKRAANGVKYKFRMNPNTYEFVYRDTVPTFQGRRILADHLWGKIRQPNYAGDILALISFGIPMYWKFSWPPVVCILLLIVLLIHRSIRVNARNFDRYSSAWTRYSTKVRYMILPKVF